jgi:hypothetical protein
MKGDKLITIIYSPISLLRSLFSKKYIYSRLYNDISTNNILVKEKYAFRSNSSNETVSYSVINEILKAVNNGPSVEEIFCDLDKAFDYFICGIIVDKLEFRGISAKFLTLILSFIP